MKVFLGFLVCAAVVSLAPAIPAEPGWSPGKREQKKSGFFLGGELGALVGFGEGEVFGAPGKLDLLAGYQINPHFSVAADLWTFWFIAYAAEAHVKANLTDSKVSPYAVGTFGVVAIINVFEEEETGGAALTYSAGLGADFHLWRQGTLFAEARYRGGRPIGDFDVSAHGLEAGVGFRWTF